MSITAVRTRRLAGITALGAVSALALSGCGSSVPELEEIWPQVRENIQNAESVSISGEMDQDGEKVALDLSGHMDDSSFSGNVSSDGISMELIGNQEATYIKPDAAFWDEQGGAAMKDMVGDKWIEAPADAGMSMSSFYEGFRDEAPEDADVQDAEYTSEEVEHDGQQVYKYSGTDKDSGEPIILMIDKDNQLVRIERQGAADEAGVGAVDFRDWNSVGTVEMPADDEIFSMPGM